MRTRPLSLMPSADTYFSRLLCDFPFIVLFPFTVLFPFNSYSYGLLGLLAGCMAYKLISLCLLPHCNVCAAKGSRACMCGGCGGLHVMWQ